MSTQKRTQVENINEAISVLVQTANLAQSRGILTLEDAVIVKSAIDFVTSPEDEEGPEGLHHSGE
jgi:flagellar motor component MotA